MGPQRAGCLLFLLGDLTDCGSSQNGKANQPSQNGGHNPIATQLINAVTISAVAGLGGVAVFLARASASWFHG